jgi:hypothetical protein
MYEGCEGEPYGGQCAAHGEKLCGVAPKRMFHDELMTAIGGSPNFK